MVTIHFLGRLGAAAILGMVIGLERELRKKPLGLKTCLVISITSCLLTYVSIEGAFHLSKAYARPMDPLRLAAQVVSGLGFIGAGAILRRNDMISGLTTAAMVWGAGGIGIATGAGYWEEALIATFLMIASVELLPHFIKVVGPSSLQEKELRIKIMVDDSEKMTAILKQMKNFSMRIQSVRVKDENEYINMETTVLIPKSLYTTDVYHFLKNLEHVKNVDVERD
jgi:putative Mg2+ transporter-C (MgtC) family protein